MAIRSGSGGLKYPLPNRAQIQAQQNAAAASAGGSASASAYGANRRYAGLKKQLQYDAFESGLDRQFRAQQSSLDRGFRAEQAYFDREHQMGGQLEAQRSAAERQQAQLQQQRELQYEGQYFDAEQNRQNRDFTMERDKALFEQDQTAFERDVDAGIESDIRSGKLTLPPAAQRRIEELEATRAANPNLDPEQQAEFDRIYEQERRKAIRQAQPPSGPSATARASGGQTFYDPQTGGFSEEMGPGRVPGFVDQEGRFEPTVAPSGDDGEYRKEVTKRATSLVGEPNPRNNNLPYTHEQALEAAAQQMQAEDDFFAPPEPEGAGGAGQMAGQPQLAAPQGDTPQGMGESVQARSSVAPEQEGLPEGLPQGSAWIDSNSIRLPDGRIIRRAGQNNG